MRQPSVIENCRICNNSQGNILHQAREMMFGFGDVFSYVECADCGCVQIIEIPLDMQRYYPSHYYSRQLNPPDHFQHLVTKNIINIVVLCLVFLDGTLADLIERIHPQRDLKSLGRIKLTRASKILDVGCGAGHLLHKLKTAGFDSVLGVDPYVGNDIEYPNGVRIVARTLDRIEGSWDLIMFHHSFEHLATPVESLQQVRRLLADNGTCLIRIPVASSFAWNYYGTDWVQLDAPRHFFLHTEESMRILARRSALEIVDIAYDSSDFQFWGSEQYRMGIPLESPKSYLCNPSHSVFSPAQMRSFRKKARLLNKQRQGDQAAFYLQRS